jgi:predicted chitinase
MIALSALRIILVTLLTLLAAAAGQSILRLRPACDPNISSCAPNTAPKKCEPISCFKSHQERERFEEENNCKFPPCSDTLTEVPVEVLREIFPAASISRLTAIADELNAALRNVLVKGLIDTKRKLAHFLAQVEQEVGPKLTLVESFDYSVDGLKKGPFEYFRDNPEEAEKYGRKVEIVEETKIVKGKPVKVKVKKVCPADQEAIANRAYANRDNGNGDVASGDGWRYRGRGMIQLTGKSNYQAFTTQHNMIWPDDARDFVLNPDLVAEEKYAMRSALVFWKNNGLDKIAVKGITCTEVDKITARVNEGTDTYTARCNNLRTIMKLNFFKECNSLKDIVRP